MERLEELGRTYKECLQEDTKTIVSSCDEKTGIQALRHLHVEAMKQGKAERKDPEYERNGTTTLLASLLVKTGTINAYTLGKTRKEWDFLGLVKDNVATDPDGEHIIICDQLNVHKSENLVRWVAQQIDFKGALGAKGKTGILCSMKSRMEFLEDKTHRIRFLYTPKHCSWMNQIENWFGKLQKKVISRGEFDSVKNLEEKIAGFIDYYNAYMYKPMKWKFEGEAYRDVFMK